MSESFTYYPYVHINLWLSRFHIKEAKLTQKFNDYELLDVMFYDDLIFYLFRTNQQ